MLKLGAQRTSCASGRPSTHLHLTNVGSFVVETLEQGRDTEETPNPVMYDVSDSFAIRCEPNLQSTVNIMIDGRDSEGGCTHILPDHA